MNYKTVINYKIVMNYKIVINYGIVFAFLVIIMLYFKNRTLLILCQTENE